MQGAKCLVAGFSGEEYHIVHSILELKPSHVTILEHAEPVAVLVSEILAKQVGAVLEKRRVALVRVENGRGVGTWAKIDPNRLIIEVKKALRELIGGEPNKSRCERVYLAVPPDSSVLAAVYSITVAGLREEEAKRITLRLYGYIGRERVYGEGEGVHLICPRVYFQSSYAGNPGVWRVHWLLVKKTFIENRAVGPAELSRELGMPRTTVHRKLRHLVNMGYAERVPAGSGGSGERSLYRATLRGLMCG